MSTPADKVSREYLVHAALARPRGERRFHVLDEEAEGEGMSTVNPKLAKIAGLVRELNDLVRKVIHEDEVGVTIEVRETEVYKTPQIVARVIVGHVEKFELRFEEDEE